MTRQTDALDTYLARAAAIHNKLTRLRQLADVDRPEFCRHSVAVLRVAPLKLYR